MKKAALVSNLLSKFNLWKGLSLLLLLWCFLSIKNSKKMQFFFILKVHLWLEITLLDLIFEYEPKFKADQIKETITVFKLTHKHD